MERASRDKFYAEKDKSRKRCRDNQDLPPHLPDSDPSKKRRHASDASGLTQPRAPQSSDWKTSDTREALFSSSRQKSAPHSEQPIEDVPILDDVNISDSEDTDTAHLPKIKTRPDWLNPVPKEDLPATLEPDWTGDMSSFVNWFCKRIGKKKLSKADLEGSPFKVVRPFHDNNISLQFQMEEYVSKPLPLRGPPGQVTIQTQYFFNKDLEYLVSGDKGRRSTLSISMLKAAQYLYFRLEELVPSLWIESERDYDTSAAYGISHWWFKRKEFYNTRHSAPSDRSKVRSDMRILSVASLKTFERYMYTFLKEIVLRRADYKEYKISEVDFKNLHPNDFEDLYMLHLQGQLNHLSGADKDASDFLFKEDYTIVSKSRVVIYRDRNDQKKMMRETEMHKFCDGTLNRILDKLDHMVKDFKLFKYNPGMETRIWYEDDKRRSKEFMEVIERRLKITRIFKSLKIFVGGRLRDVDYKLIKRTE
ncbi:hypothetical protein Tco_0570560 [Tanacetum coccineum]